MGGKCPPSTRKIFLFFLNLPLFLQIFAFSMGFAPFCENCALFPRLPPGLVKSLPPLNVTFKYVRSPFFYILFGQNQRSLRGVLRLQKKSTKLPEPILALSSKLRNFLTIFLELEKFKLYGLMVSFSLNEFSKQQFSFE